MRTLLALHGMASRGALALTRAPAQLLLVGRLWRAIAPVVLHLISPLLRVGDEHSGDHTDEQRESDQPHLVCAVDGR